MIGRLFEPLNVQYRGTRSYRRYGDTERHFLRQYAAQYNNNNNNIYISYTVDCVRVYRVVYRFIGLGAVPKCIFVRCETSTDICMGAHILTNVWEPSLSARVTGCELHSVGPKI